MKLLKIAFLLSCTSLIAQVANNEIIGLNQYRKALHLGVAYTGATGTEDFSQQQQERTQTTYLFKSGSWGKGIHLKMGYSYKVHPNLGLGIEGAGFIGINSDLKNQYYEDSASETTFQVLSYRATNWRVMPYVQFDVPVNRDAALYAKLGYVLGVGKMRFTSEETIYTTSGTYDAIYKYERSGGALHGTSMALGYRFKVDDDLSFFAELNVSTLKQKVKQDQMTKAEFEGVDVLADVKKYYTTTYYVDELVVPAKSQKPNLDEADTALAYQAVHNSVGVQVGINFYFAR